VIEIHLIYFVLGPTMLKLLSQRWRIPIFIIPGYSLQSDDLSFHIFSGRDLSNGKSLMINPQSQSACCFCNLYSAQKVQENRSITFRNCTNTNRIYLYSLVNLPNKVVLVDLRLEVGISC